MGKKSITVLMAAVLLLSILFACARNADLGATTNETVEMSVASTTAVTTTAATPATTTAAEASAANSEDHALAEDYLWESAGVIPITLNGDTITVDGEGATVDGSNVTITAAGTYSISGTLTDGQLAVDTADEEVVRLILDGVTINSTTSAALNVIKAAKTVIILADDTENYLADGEDYVFANPDEDEPNATLFSKGDLTISGNGSLTVVGNYNDGIASKDGLVIASGTITVKAADDGIRGKDYLVVQAGNITVAAQGDGFKSDDEEDADDGYIAIESGNINITAGGDAIQAQTDVVITDGEFVLTSGGGHNSLIAADASAKAIKAVVNVTIDGGNFTLDSADDAIHSNTSLTINGGTFTIATGDDAIHADATVTINGGDIDITQSYEGIESTVITINDGTIHLVSSDDGINVAGGNDGSGTGGGPGRRGPRPGQEVVNYTGSEYLYITGGYIVVDAAGDGIDVNGAFEMTNGVVLVNGPTARMNGALDYDALFKLSGGFIVAAGSAGMAQTAGASSTQPALLLNFDTTLPAGTLFHIQSAEGDDILTFAPAKAYQSIAFSSPELVNGATYTVAYGGTSTGTATDGLYQDGSYSAGTEYTSFTVSAVVTTIGNTGRR